MICISLLLLIFTILVSSTGQPILPEMNPSMKCLPGSILRRSGRQTSASSGHFWQEALISLVNDIMLAGHRRHAVLDERMSSVAEML